MQLWPHGDFWNTFMSEPIIILHTNNVKLFKWQRLTPRWPAIIQLLLLLLWIWLTFTFTAFPAPPPPLICFYALPIKFNACTAEHFKSRSFLSKPNTKWGFFFHLTAFRFTLDKFNCCEHISGTEVVTQDTFEVDFDACWEMYVSLVDQNAIYYMDTAYSTINGNKHLPKP